jgi:hypothetical protein
MKIRRFGVMMLKDGTDDIADDGAKDEAVKRVVYHIPDQ